jgi:peptidoglycan/LPS O-acetylase OafA/YrhL
VARDRNYQLDSLRAFAAALVVFAHTRARGDYWGELAPLGIASFFVLSGFLITSILLGAREEAERADVGRGSVLWRFYVRRFLRIFPIYYAVLVIAVLLREPVTSQYIAELATYRANFLMARLGQNLSPITPLWSLSVEEHFYLFWPLIVLFGSRRMVYGSIAAMVAGSVVIRAMLVLQHATYQAVAWPTYSAVDSIALGCLLAMGWRDRDATARRPWILGALGVGVVLQGVYLALRILNLPHALAITRVMNTLPFALICVWLIDRAAQDRLPAIFRNRWIARMGLVTYAIYIVHRYVMHYIGFDQKRGWDVFAITLVVSTAIATVSWLVYEGPINNLKRYVPYVPRKRVEPSAVTAADDAVVFSGDRPGAEVRGMRGSNEEKKVAGIIP